MSRSPKQIIDYSSEANNKPARSRNRWLAYVLFIWLVGMVLIQLDRLQIVSLPPPTAAEIVLAVVFDLCVGALWIWCLWEDRRRAR